MQVKERQWLSLLSSPPPSHRGISPSAQVTLMSRSCSPVAPNFPQSSSTTTSKLGTAHHSREPRVRSPTKTSTSCWDPPTPLCMCLCVRLPPSRHSQHHNRRRKTAAGRGAHTHPAKTPLTRSPEAATPAPEHPRYPLGPSTGAMGATKKWFVCFVLFFYNYF